MMLTKSDKSVAYKINYKVIRNSFIFITFFRTTHFFFIRNRFIRNWTSARQKIKKLQGWSRGDLRNFQIEKIKKLNRDKKKES